MERCSRFYGKKRGQIFEKKDMLSSFDEVWNDYGFEELPYFGIGNGGAHAWFNYFSNALTERNELIYVLQNHPEFRPAEVKIEDLPDWATPQVPYDLPKNMKGH